MVRGKDLTMYESNQFINEIGKNKTAVEVAKKRRSPCDNNKQVFAKSQVSE